MDIKIAKLEYILQKNNISNCHGIEHAKSVLNNANNALQSVKTNKFILFLLKPILYLNKSFYYFLKKYFKIIDENDVKCVQYAALLHDADDHKFFPNNHNYNNLRKVLFGEPKEIVDQVIHMVSLVSASKNQDNIPNGIEEFKLIPRYSDRIEAIGIVGIARAFTYTIIKNKKLYDKTTPRLKTKKELNNYLKNKNLDDYFGESNSMMDHFIDKLLFLGNIPINNYFLKNEANIRIQEMIDFYIKFANYEIKNEFDIIKYIEENNFDVYINYEIYLL